MPAPRRTYGSGSITERRPGCWTVRISFKGTTPRIRESHTVHGSKLDAERKLRELLNRQDQHHGPIREARRTNFGQYAIDAIGRNIRARPRTREQNVYLFATYTGPKLTSVSLAHVTPALLSQERDRLLARVNTQATDGRPISAKTVVNVMGTWAIALRTAVAEGLLAVNPLRGVETPSTVTSERVGKALTPEETQRVLDAAEGTPWHALWRLLLTLGPRPSEALALRWSDIDFERGTLTVARALARVGGAWQFGPTKTRKARTIPLPLPLAVALEQHRRQQKTEKDAAGPGYQDQGLVFCDPWGRLAPIDPFKKRWKKLLKAAGVTTYRLYDCRHTAATRLVEAGTDPVNAAEILGNSAAMVLRVYGHGSLGVQRDALERVAARQEAEQQARGPRLA